MGTEQRYDIYDLFLTSRSRSCPATFGSKSPSASTATATRRRRSTRRRATRPRARRGRLRGDRRLLPQRYRNPSTSTSPAGSPGRIPELSVSLSSEVVAEIWEYQRCVTTCANAYVQPLMDRYLDGWSANSQRARFTGSCG